METLFYNIIAILIGIFILIHIIMTFKRSKNIDRICYITIGILLLSIGIGGFFLPKDYSFITVCSLLFLCIIYLIYVFTIKRKKK